MKSLFSVLQFGERHAAPLLRYSSAWCASSSALGCAAFHSTAYELYDCAAPLLREMCPDVDYLVGQPKPDWVPNYLNNFNNKCNFSFRVSIWFNLNVQLRQWDNWYRIDGWKQGKLEEEQEQEEEKEEKTNSKFPTKSRIHIPNKKPKLPKAISKKFPHPPKHN